MALGNLACWGRLRIFLPARAFSLSRGNGKTSAETDNRNRKNSRDAFSLYYDQQSTQ